MCVETLTGLFLCLLIHLKMVSNIAALLGLVDELGVRVLGTIFVYTNKNILAVTRLTLWIFL
jgi:hypothetical protein